MCVKIYTQCLTGELNECFGRRAGEDSVLCTVFIAVVCATDTENIIVSTPGPESEQIIPTQETGSCEIGLTHIYY